MVDRCTNLKHKDYFNYGGRGIEICERWKKFENFLEDMGERPSREFSIDRINNNKGYFPGNCRWATMKEQCNNRRNNKTITFNGETKTLAQWSEEIGTPLHVLWLRLSYGWSVERMLTEPVRRKNTKTFNGKTKTLAQWSEEINISVGTLRKRLNNGWSFERAITEPAVIRRNITFNGKTMTLTQWSAQVGISMQTLHTRLNELGWSIERALTEPVNRRGNHAK
jgi:hypothetical protein